jgi:hypothetical protein
MRKVRKRFQGKRLGHYLMQCDYSGQVGWDDEMRETWDGKWVLAKYWEPRHPQDFVRSIPEESGVPVSRPQSADVEVCQDIYEPADEVYLYDDFVFYKCGDS